MMRFETDLIMGLRFTGPDADNIGMKNSLLAAISGLILSSIVTVGCHRAQQTSTLKVVLPSIGALSTKAVTTSSYVDSLIKASGAALNKSDLSAASTSDSPWYGSSSLASDINCYLVTMGGPEAIFQKNYCADSSTSEIVLRFGPIYGGAKPGEIVELSAPAGSSRTITVMGMNAPSGYCYNFLSQGPPKGFITRPRVLASVTTDLKEGSNTVSISVPSSGSIAAKTELDECHVESMGSEGPSNSKIYFGDGRDGDLIFNTAGPFNLETTTFGSGSVTSSARAAELPATKKLSAKGQVSILSADAKTLSMYMPFTSDNFQVGDEVMWHVTAAWTPGGPDNACGGGLYRGNYGFARVTSATSPTLVLDTPLSYTPATLNLANINRANYKSNTTSPVPFCAIQVVRVPSFNTISGTVAATLTMTSNTSSATDLSGGLMVIRVKELRLDFNMTFDASSSGSYGFAGGGSMTHVGAGNEGFNDDSTVPVSNGSGGGIFSFNAGGGSNSGRGGLPSAGTIIDFCSIAGGSPCYFMEDRKIFLGSGGALGPVSGAAGAGGGAIIIFAQKITGANTLSVVASGQTPTAPASAGGAGGGSGGSIHLSSQSIDADVSLQAKGGNGSYTSAGNGGGGGGGVIEVKYCDNKSSDYPDAYVDAGVNDGTNLAGLLDPEIGDILIDDNPNYCNM